MRNHYEYYSALCSEMAKWQKLTKKDSRNEDELCETMLQSVKDFFSK